MDTPRHTTRRAAIAAGTALVVLLGLLAVPAAATPTGDEWELWEYSGATINVGGTYTPVVGDFGGSGLDDLLWYAPGTGPEQTWTSKGDGTFTKKALGPKVDGTYLPVVGDFGGSARDDILWYGPGSAPDRLWTQTGDFTFASAVVTINGTYLPQVLENGTAHDDILWWGLGSATAPVWVFSGSGGAHSTVALTPGAGTEPVVGHFDADQYEDVFWYGKGALADRLDRRTAAGTFTSTPQSVGGSYDPIVGDLGEPGDGIDDILWAHPTGGASSLWVRSGGGWTSRPATLPAAADAYPIALDGPEWGLVYFASAGTKGHVWYDNATTPDFYEETVGTHPVPSGAGAYLGRFLTGQPATLFWYTPGPTPEYLWYQP